MTLNLEKLIEKHGKIGKRYLSNCIFAKDALKKILPSVQNYMQLQRGSGGLQHFFSELKLYELYKMLHLYDIDMIIELGGGSTTTVFNEYCKLNSIRKCISIDESKEYQNFLRENYEFSNSVRFIRENVAMTDEFCHYTIDWKEIMKGISNQMRILVYVDGPANNNKGKILPCIDYRNMIDAGIIPDVLMFDIRNESVQDFMETQYIFDPQFSIFTNYPEDKALHHTIMERFVYE